jgi:hypothetical protein
LQVDPFLYTSTAVILLIQVTFELPNMPTNPDLHAPQVFVNPLEEHGYRFLPLQKSVDILLQFTLFINKVATAPLII